MNTTSIKIEGLTDAQEINVYQNGYGIYPCGDLAVRAFRGNHPDKAEPYDVLLRAKSALQQREPGLQFLVLAALVNSSSIVDTQMDETHRLKYGAMMDSIISGQEVIPNSEQALMIAEISIRKESNYIL